MKIINDYTQAATLLLKNNIGIIPTDTIYGISCLASSEVNVEKVYAIKQRDLEKPFIVLISSIQDLRLFNINLSIQEETILHKYWPGPVSIIFDVRNNKLGYLHRGTNTLAIRQPSKHSLLELLKITGPIVSTSANVSAFAPIKSAAEAQRMFDEKLDFFLDDGELNNPPSKIIKLIDGTETVIRD